MLDLSMLSEDDRDRLRSFLLTQQGIKTLPVSQPKALSKTKPRAKIPTILPKKPYVPQGGWKLTPPRRVKTFGAPQLYYCGACPVFLKRNSGGGRRMNSMQEVEAHAISSHPHFPFFGLWPLSRAVKHIASTFVEKDLVVINAALGEVLP